MTSSLIFLYDQVLEGASRLACFATSLEPVEKLATDFQDDVDHVAALLAKRDLLVFAASLRNFAEASNTIALMKESRDQLSELFLSGGPPYHRPTTSLINLYQALSRILHAHQIELLSEQHDFLHEIFRHDFMRFLHALRVEAANRPDLPDPLILMATSKDGKCLVRLRALLTMTDSYLSKVLERLAAKQVFLSRSLRDI